MVFGDTKDFLIHRVELKELIYTGTALKIDLNKGEKLK